METKEQKRVKPTELETKNDSQNNEVNNNIISY